MTEEEFIKQIKQTPNPKEFFVKELQETTLPIVLYGMGDYASTVFNFLKKRGVQVHCVCVDDHYCSTNTREWNNLPVIPFSQIDHSIQGTYLLVIGIARFKEVEKNLPQLSGMIKSYFFDSISFYKFFDYNYIQANASEFVHTYNALADEKSRSVLRAYINGKITSYPDELYNYVEGDQYFPKDIINLNDQEIFVDAGAYTGDTLRAFIEKTDGDFAAYYAFEPDSKNFSALKSYVDGLDKSTIHILNKGAWNSAAELRFRSDDHNTVKSSISALGEIVVPVDAIDNVLNGTAATFIKMDIEGAECEAIMGAQQTILKYKPKLAISAYHKWDDLFRLPQLVHSIRSDYKFYLRHHLQITQELVLYAI